ncbi:sigma-70 family RNA polymerase sigma factor [Thermomicrobiaceae bacterium CFH 74404]|uniref:Sigma-70 family RNA polymerase sigma factor n=1 Tax=Thermalbibacter longus TaxID=2951981 RepID=A0AA41WCA8_9BACT|nr:sigma-70 family RNA polymerase sigma factor [Thermalbibacter longus]MCM8747625.1 sigma-70 family RNA polymerase sigma factor [Thermalbibacter longus]
MDDRDLVLKARQGDVDAYAELVRRYSEIAFRTAYLITRDAPEAEDAAQEAFVKAYYALDRFRTGAPFRPWLLRIVANEARNRRMRMSRQVSLQLRVAASNQEAGTILPSPEAVALGRDQRQALLEALETLREEDRLVIIYRYFLELSEAEIAEALGCARGTVKSRLSRALGRLRDRLAPEARPEPRGELRSSDDD